MKLTKIVNNIRLFVLLLIIFPIIGIAFLEDVKQGKKYAVNNMTSTDPKSISLLTANVGNNSLGCRKVINKLCYKDVEKRIADNIRLLNPDIVALQEVLAPWQCRNINEINPEKVCSESQEIPQARRLLGDNYTIICSSRNQFECIGVHVDIGIIVGCEPGSFCNNARTTPEFTACDNGFTISAATILLKNGFEFDVVNFHPQSTSASCRAKMINAVFDQNFLSTPIISKEFVLLMGDFNFDPWRDYDESVSVWNTRYKEGWHGSNFQYHSGILESNPPYITTTLLFMRRTVDFIVSNFGEGTCNVLGESPGTFRLDGGKGMDHRAVYGVIRIKK